MKIQKFISLLQAFVDATNSYVNSIQLGDSSYYSPSKDIIVVEEKLFNKSQLLAIYVGLHEAAHAYQQDRVVFGMTTTYLINFVRRQLQLSFYLTTTVLTLVLWNKHLAWYAVGLIIAASISVIYFEYEASRKAINYARKQLSIRIKSAERYLWLALQTYILAGVGNIALALMFITNINAKNLLICFVWVLLVKIPLARNIKSKMQIIEEELCDEDYPEQG
ncbi:MAG: zinc metallopeptidase [Candidatus Peribacteria bacterium]|nr:MAG: zinc metallopeptidase [Candidatus Peribacteria bacterium]